MIRITRRILRTTASKPNVIYRPKTPAGLPGFSSGGEPLSRGLGKALARAGFVALVLDQKEELFDPETADMKFTDAVLRQSVSDARKAITWLEQRDDVDPERIGCVGIS
ncbi:MAG: hypothetical protein QF886_17125, partial [Planctomycetota bacterium]|nr:hypothetical protein [Planctomycetota bacterium]